MPKIYQIHKRDEKEEKEMATALFFPHPTIGPVNPSFCLALSSSCFR